MDLIISIKALVGMLEYMLCMSKERNRTFEVDTIAPPPPTLSRHGHVSNTLISGSRSMTFPTPNEYANEVNDMQIIQLIFIRP
jgi:hypothetical protein